MISFHLFSFSFEGRADHLADVYWLVFLALLLGKKVEKIDLYTKCGLSRSFALTKFSLVSVRGRVEIVKQESICNFKLCH